MTDNDQNMTYLSRERKELVLLKVIFEERLEGIKKRIGEIDAKKS
jgi:hypothetical protein